MNTADAVGAHGGYQQSNTGTDIRGRHIAATQFETVVMSDYYGAVRVAQNDLRSHVYQFVHEEEAAFKHLLMNQHAAFRLCGNYQQYAQQVRRQSGPGRIGYCHDRTVYEGFYLISILGRHINIIAPLFHFDTQTSETVGDDT